MIIVELCYETAKGAGVVRHFSDATLTEKALKSLAKRHIEADLYVVGVRDEHGNRAQRVGGVDTIECKWHWWFDPDAFESISTQETFSRRHPFNSANPARIGNNCG